MKGELKLYDWYGHVVVKIPSPGCFEFLYTGETFFRIIATDDEALYNFGKNRCRPGGESSEDSILFFLHRRRISIKKLPLYVNKKYKSKEFMEMFKK